MATIPYYEQIRSIAKALDSRGDHLCDEYGAPPARAIWAQAAKLHDLADKLERDELT